MDTKAVNIDYHFLDNETCPRCMETEKVLENTLDKVGDLLKNAGYKLILNKVKMDTRQKAVQHQFIKSPTIRVNNIDIGFEQTENTCSDCGEVCGCDENTSCRTWMYMDKEYEVPPKELITERILQAVFGKHSSHENEFKLPENLDNYYSNEKKQCCDSSCCS